MSFRVKILFPFILLLLLVGGFIKYYWLPGLVNAEVERMKYQEEEFIKILGSSLTPDLMTGDLAEVYGTLSRALMQRIEWQSITLKDPNGHRLYPLKLYEHDSHGEILLFTHQLYYGPKYLGEMLVEIDIDMIAKRIEEPVSDLELMIQFILLILSAACVLFIEFWLLNPLRELQRGAAKLAQGDFSVALPSTHSKDEIGRLIHSFNAMRDDLHQRDSDLRAERNFTRAIVDSAGCLIVVLDRAGQVVMLNPAGETLTGYSNEEVEGKCIFDIFILPEDRDEVFSIFEDLKTTNLPRAYEDQWRTKNGENITLSWTNACTCNEQGEVEYVIAIGIDVTERNKLQAQVTMVMKNLAEVNASLSKYVDVVDHNVITSKTDLKGTIVYVSEAFCNISGYSAEELIGNPHNIVRHPDVPSSLYVDMWQTIQSGKVWKGEIKNLAKNGQAYWVDVTITPEINEDGQISGYTAIRQDITYRKQVEKMAITDALTGLNNRRHFDEVYVKELKRTKRDHKTLAFIMFDVDHFKQYNDTYGHQMGDEVLKAIGNTLNDYLQRPSDYGFRLGGEEFGILVEEMSEEEAFQFADRYRQVIEDLKIEHKHNSASPYVTVSVGVGVIPTDMQVGKDNIIKIVDDALYQAKDQGRNQVQRAAITVES